MYYIIKNGKISFSYLIALKLPINMGIPKVNLENRWEFASVEVVGGSV